MKKRLIVGIVAGVLAFSGLYASNMVFKIDYTLRGNDTSLTGQTTLALPYCQETSLVNANNLITDIGGTGVVQLIAKFVPETNGKIAYSGTAGTPFDLVAGEGYFVELKPGVATRNYVIAGSHDPSISLGLLGLDHSGGNKAHEPFALTGNNFIAPPYSLVSNNASLMMNEIGAVVGKLGTEAVQSVGRVEPSTNGLVTYSGTAGTPFAIVAGESYVVQLKPTQTTIDWTPAHY